ncbi:DEAD/DEAH box helicase [Catellatospora citrea]|uniref:DEAD/DEAH box helicase n=1 Tax=Catellatospora citrea TaxID=53366 RepID=UPI0033F46AB0
MVPPQPTPSAAVPSHSYELLDRRVQQWIYEKGWTQLRDAQERAIPVILGGADDVIVAAATASGKTEAAWLPICSALLDHQAEAGVKALYIGPLKALINDQFDRLGQLCEHLSLPAHRWHGDVPGSRKAHMLRNPDGILLITPESLESLFVNHGPALARILAGLRYVVVDELHSFIGSERGAQLQSLLHRVELLLRRRVARIGLSATLGDFTAAADFLRPGRAAAVKVISSDDDNAEIRLQLRGYVDSRPPRNPPPRITTAPLLEPQEPEDASDESVARVAIADHLFSALRGRDNLVFANSKAAVETFTDLLNRRSIANRVPEEFVPHHGNLSKELREHVESRLKDRSMPVTAICTSTLEMGIDIGSVDSVAQLGAPASVSGLRQRLGRSGRRQGQPAVMRLYVTEDEINERTPPADMLRSQLVQTIAMVELLLEKWYEAPDTADLHLSTLVQQILSVIAQRGGAQPGQLFDALCGAGPFNRVDKTSFAALLRSLGRHDVLSQSTEGLLLAGGLGDKIVNNYAFYSAFTSPEEYRLHANGRNIGSLPVDYPIAPGMLLIFGGRRWKIVSIDNRQKVIELTRSSGGRPPSFSGGGGEVADTVRQRMKQIYHSTEVPRYLDQVAQQLLDQGRSAFHRYHLDNEAILDWGNDTLLFPWRGDRIMNTLAATFTSHGLEVGQDGVALTVHGTTGKALQDLIDELSVSQRPSPVDLAAKVPTKESGKYDAFLDEDLLNVAYAARSFDVAEAWSSLKSMTPSRPQS